jgi:hypothetical protein
MDWGQNMTDKLQGTGKTELAFAVALVALVGIV